MSKNPDPEPELDESTLLSSLAHLQELHIALRSLRETLPTLTSSIIASSASPEELYQNFSQAARNAGKSIKDFTVLMGEKKTREIFELVRESKRRDREEVGVWQVAEHGDWMEVGKPEAGTAEVGKAEEGAAAGEEVKDVVEAFRGRFPAIEVGLEEEMGVIKVNLPPPANIAFQVEGKRAIDGNTSYTVTSEEKTKLQKAIVETVNERVGSNGLNYLLDMLASYEDVKTRPCNNCSRLLDRNAQFPVVRIKERTPQADGNDKINWQALHASCA